MHIYEVGGTVRDDILGRKGHDRDFVVVGASVEEMLNKGYKKVGKNFPVFLHPKTKEEYALARKEIKIGKRHQDFSFIFTPDITLKEDSLRRDFTCNALYRDKESGEIIDYHNGIADINNHILRHISEHFREDPLRVLRMCRFAAELDFDVANETMSLCQEMVRNDCLKYISKERIWQELKRALSCKNFAKFVLVAKTSGVLEKICPELDILWSIPERTDYHPEGNTGEHIILALKAADTDDSFVNYAILTHDIGKIKTPKENWPSHRGHEQLGEELIQSVSKKLNVPIEYTKFAAFAARNHTFYRKKENDKAMIDLAEALMHFKNKESLLRYRLVMLADIRGRLNGVCNADSVIINEFCDKLQKIINLMQKTKISQMEGFAEILKDVKQGKIDSKEIKEFYKNEILKLLKNME